jgi:hypothetical protein
MDPVSNVGQLVEVLRKQLARSRKSTGTPARDAPAAAAAGGARPGIAELKKQVTEKLRRIDPDAPRARHESVHVFLESVLLWEFGERLMDDPKFYALLDDVQSSMESDSALGDDLTALLASLR